MSAKRLCLEVVSIVDLTVGDARKCSGWQPVTRAAGEIKQGMVLAAGRDPEQGWDELNILTLTAFFNVLGVLVRAGVTSVAEAAFQQRLWAPNLMAVAPVVDIRIVHCTASESVIRDRIAGRAEHDPHRRAHNDNELLAQIAAGRYSVEQFESVDLDVPALTVDTTDGYRPGLDVIAEFANRPGRRGPT
ncbi:AAA family ATPase [Nocardia sp. NPDC003963]